MTATNAAGPHTLAFGSMRPWVRAIDCIFADGSRGEVRRGSHAARPSSRRSGFSFRDQPTGGSSPIRRSLDTPACTKDSSGYGVVGLCRER